MFSASMHANSAEVFCLGFSIAKNLKFSFHGELVGERRLSLSFFLGGNSLNLGSESAYASRFKHKHANLRGNGRASSQVLGVNAKVACIDVSVRTSLWSYPGTPILVLVANILKASTFYSGSSRIRKKMYRGTLCLAVASAEGVCPICCT
jgi:hypothetical protein